MPLTPLPGRGFPHFRKKNGAPTGPLVWHVAGAMAATAFGTLVATANQVIGVPFFTGRGGLVNFIALNVTTLAAGNCRLGILANAPPAGEELYPGALLFDSGNISTGTAGVKSAAPNLVLPPDNVVWLVCNFSAAPTVRSVPIAAAYPALGIDTAMGTAQQSYLVEGGAFPTLNLAAPTAGVGAFPALALELA